MVKLLEFVQSSNYGSPHTNILSFIHTADRNKFEIATASYPQQIFKQNVINSNIPFFEISLPKIFRHSHLHRFEAIVNEFKPDLIRCHDSTSGFYGRILRKHRKELRVIQSFTSIELPYIENSFVRNSVKAIGQYLVQYTDRFILNTNIDRNIAQNLKIINPENTVVIPKSIDISRFANSRINPELKKAYGFGEKDFIIGCVSGFGSFCNLGSVVQVGYFLREKYPDIKFLIIGNGRNFRKLRNFVFESNLSKTIKFTGEINNPEQYYPLFDIYLLPTSREKISYSLLEAMASKLPVLCSSTKSHFSFLKDESTALFFSISDGDSLFHKICKLYEDKNLREKLAHNALIEATQFDSESVLEIIQKTIGDTAAL